MELFNLFIIDFKEIIVNIYNWELTKYIITACLAGLFAGWFAKKFSDIKDDESAKKEFIEYLNSEISKSIINYFHAEQLIEIIDGILINNIKDNSFCFENKDIVHIEKIILEFNSLEKVNYTNPMTSLLHLRQIIKLVNKGILVSDYSYKKSIGFKQELRNIKFLEYNLIRIYRSILINNYNLHYFKLPAVQEDNFKSFYDIKNKEERAVKDIIKIINNDKNLLESVRNNNNLASIDYNIKKSDEFNIKKLGFEYDKIFINILKVFSDESKKYIEYEVLHKIKNQSEDKS